MNHSGSYDLDRKYDEGSSRVTKDNTSAGRRIRWTRPTGKSQGAVSVLLQECECRCVV